MASTREDLVLEPSPSDRRRRRARCGRRVLGWAGATALVATGAALATTTFTGDGGSRVETPGRQTSMGVPACVWATEVDGPVFPAEDLGAAPTSGSVLAFETCNGEWTGDMAWMDSGGDVGPGSDDGLPNAWEAGNEAVARHLEGSDRP